jgi:Rrf2 family protein
MLSQTTEYALRAMVWLAYAGDELMPTPTLAKHTKVPMNYLAKVLQSLSKAELVVGRRGVGGGYKLSRKPSRITMLEVINAISPVTPIESCPLGIKSHGSHLCPLHRRLDSAARLVIQEFGAVTLADILSEPDSSQPLCDSGRLKSLGLTMDGQRIAPREK